MLYKNITETIGNTPLVECNNIKNKYDLKANLYVKLESFNPGGSIKDRPVYNMLTKAIEDGKINHNTTIIDATSGNTGIALAMICASLNLRCMLVMPDSMSIERFKILKQFNAEIILTPGNGGMPLAIEKANELKDNIDNSIILGQFSNENNYLVHYYHTAREIMKDLNNKVDIFVAGIGTGGTITGCGKVLKEELDNVYVVGVEPKESPFISEGIKGPHKIQGIGAGFLPDILDVNYIDKIMLVESDKAIISARILTACEGISAGISAGASFQAAFELAQLEENKDKNIVFVLPDGFDKYLSTELFANNE